MARTILAFCVIALIAATAGCRMGDDPYDYCGPLYTGDSCGPACAPFDRAGSVLQCGCGGGGCDSCGGGLGSGVEMIPATLPVDFGDGFPASDRIQPVPDDYSKSVPRHLPSAQDQVRWAHSVNEGDPPNTGRVYNRTRR